MSLLIGPWSVVLALLLPFSPSSPPSSFIFSTLLPSHLSHCLYPLFHHHLFSLSPAHFLDTCEHPVVKSRGWSDKGEIAIQQSEEELDGRASRMWKVRELDFEVKGG